jgi:Amidases related to nicotinamidase
MKNNMRLFKTMVTCLLLAAFTFCSAQNRNSTKKALLIMDMQVPILKGMPGDVLSPVAKAAEFARKNDITVIYVRATMRQGAPEINTNNKFFDEHRVALENVDVDAWSAIPSQIAPKKGDLIVDKRRFSSFEGTDLEIILRSKGYSELILCGVMTSGVVLSTVRDAADKDYKITVLSDACADPNPETNDFLMKKIFPLQANVISTQQWITQ